MTAPALFVLLYLLVGILVVRACRWLLARAPETDGERDRVLGHLEDRGFAASCVVLWPAFFAVLALGLFVSVFGRLAGGTRS